MIDILETNLEFKQMDIRKKTERIILHHADAIECMPEQIHEWHLERNWSGSGYHFFIKKNGTIYRLRPEENVGAHAFGSNYNSIGICAEGRYTIEKMTDEQAKSISLLIKYLKEKYNINIIQKHSDVNNTSCPGVNFLFDRIINESNVDFKIDKKGEIAQIQKQLNDKYKLNIIIDNIYGNETKGALVFGLQRELNVQFYAGLVEDKIFGKKTKEACINVNIGAKGNITWLIQSMLICHSFDIENDGIFGEKTLSAIKEFQKRNGLVVDGIVGKNTFYKMFK